ncbi:MAG: ABC transporter substrate-binding protein [Thermomicrobiales bacterium]
MSRTTSRRRFTMLAAAVPVSLALAGYAPATLADEAASETSRQGELLPAAEGLTHYPLTLQTAWGEVTIPERPERVVAASWRGELSWLLALGVTPVAVESAEWAIEAAPWAPEMLAQPIEHTWDFMEVALKPEPIAAAKPDLIWAGSLGAEPVSNLRALQAIAPVLAQPDTGGVVPTWQENLLLVGEALDLKQTAQRVIDDYEAFFTEFQAQHPGFAGKVIAYVEFWGDSAGNEIWFGNPAGSEIDAFFSRLGFASNPADLTDAEALSPELVGLIEGDILIIIDYSPAEDEGKQFQEFLGSALFQSIPAAQAGNVIRLSNPERTTLYLDGEEVGATAHPSITFDDPIGSPRFAEMLAPLIEPVLAD